MWESSSRGLSRSRPYGTGATLAPVVHSCHSGQTMHPTALNPQWLPLLPEKKIHTCHTTFRATDLMASLTLLFFHSLCSAPYSEAFQTHRSDPASGPLHLLSLALPGYLSPR